MPRRRQASRRWLAGEHGDLFVVCDGVTPMFDADEPDCHENVFVARAAWRQVRAQSWAHPHRDRMWPPVGAVVYDDIGEAARETHPSKLGAAWSPAVVRDAVDADAASVARFREVDPAGAAAVSDHLDAYVSDLRVLAALAEELEGDRVALMRGWAGWEMFDLRRRRR